MATTTTVESTQKLTQNPWVVCLTCALFFLYEFIQMNMFNSISPEMIKTFKVNASELGNFSAMYLYATTIFVFFVGATLDRFSVRKLVLAAMASCVIFTTLFAISTSLVMAEVFRFLSGISGAYCFLSCIVLASRWFPAKQLALATGLIVTMAMIGGTLAQTPLTMLVASVGWRHAILLDSILGAVFLLAMYFVVSDYPASHVHKTKTKTQRSFLGSIYHAISGPQNWLCGTYTSLMNLMILVMGATWGNAYLEGVHHLSRTEASIATMMIYIGTIIGSPAVGWYSDKIGKRRRPMIEGAIAALFLSMLLILTPNLSTTAVSIILFALGFVTSTQIISYPVIFESNPKDVTGSCESLASFVILGGGALFQYVYGVLLDNHWQGQIINGVRSYSSADHVYAFYMIPIAIVISLVLALLIKETNCEPYSNNKND